MPYLKKVKDLDGAIAEAIASSIANLAQIPHPTEENDVDIAVSIESQEQILVALPTFTFDTTFAEMAMFSYFNAIESNSDSKAILPLELNDELLLSLGETIAFNWYVGQGDLNATNVSVVGGKCYPYDFDYCFEDMHGDNSFVHKNHMSYVHTSLNTTNGCDEIIKAAVGNIISSLATFKDEETGMHPGMMLENLNKPSIQKKISEGFHSQLIKMNSINSEDIVNKYVINDKQKKICLNFLANKQKEIEKMLNNFMEINSPPTPTVAKLDEEFGLFIVPKEDQLIGAAKSTPNPYGQVAQIGMFGIRHTNKEKSEQITEVQTEKPSNTAPS